MSGVLVALSDGLPPVRVGYSKGLIAVRRLMTITSEAESHAPLLVREQAGLRSGGPVAALVALRSADRRAIRRAAGAGYQATTQTLGWIEPQRRPSMRNVHGDLLEEAFPDA
jgi:hypothetical protein